MEKPQVSTLKNGLTIITQHTPTKQIYANVTVNVGYRHERPEETSITHFLEHMAASDTTRLTKQEKDSTIRRMRGQTNASTSLERTDYFIRVGNEFTEDAIQMLSDGILRPKFDQKTVDVERKAVQQELIGKATNAPRIAYEQLIRRAFPDTQLDKDILGSVDIVEGHERDTLKAFMDKHYTADNMVLTVVGDVNHQQICDMAEKHFADLRSKPAESRAPLPAAEYRGGMETRDSNENEQISFYMGFEGSGRADAHTNAVDTVMGSILGDGFSSRLMKSLRSDKGLVYSTSAGNIDFHETGVFALSAGTTAKNLGKAVDAMIEEVNRFADTVTEEELETVKASLLGELERSIESPRAVGSNLAVTKAVDGKIYDIDAEIADLQSVTLEEVQQRAREIFSTAPSISAYGKGATESMPPYEEITRKLGKERQLGENGFVRADTPSADRAVADAQVAGRPPVQKQQAMG